MSAAVTPRPAATLMLVRDGADGLEVLMVARAREVEFASGALVFPGGRVEPGDAALAPGDEPLGAFRVAAIREAWEESGVLLAHPPGPGIPADGAFLRHLHACGVRPDHAALTHFAHWVTPEHSPKRFDTHFFLARAPENQQAVHDGHEAVEAIWIKPEAALLDADAGRRTLVFPTRLNLMRLARERMADAAIAAAARAPIVTVMPQPFADGEGGTMLRIPEAAGYGGSVFRAKGPPASGGRWPT